MSRVSRQNIIGEKKKKNSPFYLFQVVLKRNFFEASICLRLLIIKIRSYVVLIVVSLPLIHGIASQDVFFVNKSFIFWDYGIICLVKLNDEPSALNFMHMVG